MKMKRAFVVLSGLLLATLVCGRETHAQDGTKESVRQRDATACELVRLVNAALPRSKDVRSPGEYWSWSVWYEPQLNLIEVLRDQAVLMPPRAVINGPAFDERKPVLERPSFSFRVEPWMSPERYNRFLAENKIMDAHLAKMQTEMKGITRKFDSFLPGTNEQKNKVDAYNRLKSARHHLPDFYFRNISLSWADFNSDYEALLHSPGRNPSFVTSSSSSGPEREQADAAQAVLRLLSRYESDEK